MKSGNTLYIIFFSISLLIYSNCALSQWDYSQKFSFENKDFKSELIPSTHRGIQCYKYIFTPSHLSGSEINDLKNEIKIFENKSMIISNDKIYEVIGITFDSKLVTEDYSIGYISDNQIFLKTPNYSISHTESKIFYISNYYKNLTKEIESIEIQNIRTLTENINNLKEELKTLSKQLDEVKIEYISKKRVHDAILSRQKREADSLKVVEENRDLAYRKSLKIGDEYKNSIVFFKDVNEEHGLMISKKEINISYENLCYGKAYSYEYLGSKNQLKLKAEQDCEILMQKKYFSEYSGYRIPKLKEIILIREAYKASSLFKKTIRESNSANNSNV